MTGAAAEGNCCILSAACGDELPCSDLVWSFDSAPALLCGGMACAVDAVCAVWAEGLAKADCEIGLCHVSA